MSTAAIAPIQSVAPSFDFRGVMMTRSKTGHVHSFWWSYDWRAYNLSGPYVYGSHFHGLRDASVRAFAEALKIDPYYVVVSVRTNPVDWQLEWRCGSAHPVEIPLVLTKARKTVGLAAIEI